jgi:hypothetical protein
VRIGKKSIANLVFFVLASYSINLYADINVGVYYFPGWIKSAPLKPNDPWLKIKKYPDKEPLLGWYKDGDPHATEQQISWMHDAGINFVIYDWYWLENHGVTLNQAIEAFKASTLKKGIQFSILWANHFDSPQAIETFDEVVDYWIANYFSSSDYKTIDGKPVVFIFAPSELEKKARRFGMSSKNLIDRARERAVKSGLKGIYFVGVSQALSHSLSEITINGYDALTAYNYHYGMSGSRKNSSRPSTNYQELTDGYQQSWRWIIDNASIPYFVPVTSGWDKRPWGGSKALNHDDSISTPQQFGAHILAAKKVINSNREKTLGHMIVCCWNEYGEGSYIEPTKKFGTEYIETLKQSLDKKD